MNWAQKRKFEILKFHFVSTGFFSAMAESQVTSPSCDANPDFDDDTLKGIEIDINFIT